MLLPGRALQGSCGCAEIPKLLSAREGRRTCETAWETGPFAAARASLTGSGRLAEAASAAELAAPAVALMLSCSKCAYAEWHQSEAQYSNKDILSQFSRHI